MTHTYQTPAFLVEHLGAGLATTDISTTNATVADRGVEKLIDYRTAAPLEFSTSAANHDIELDFGVATSIGAMFIPPTHNLGTTTVEVFSGASSPAATSEGTKAATDGASFEFDWTPASARYWRIAFNATGAWQIPELVLASQIRTVVRGPDFRWETPVRSPINVAEFPGFESSLVLAAARRRWIMTQSHMADAGDLAIWDALQALGRARPFVVLPPDDSYTWTWVRLESDFSYRQDFAAPMQALRYTAEAELVEQL